ncbi:MAG: TIGR00725 family protein [Candidatus Helarchaeota archaeon]
MKQISVIGAGVLQDRRIYEFTRELGRALAKNGYIVVCGGKGGVMEAVCRGVHDENGISVAILPSINDEEANEYAFIRIPTGLGEERNRLVVQSASVIICIAGERGTRMEAKYALKLKKPLITVPHTGGVSEEFSTLVSDNMHVANDIKEILTLLKEITKN